MTKDTKKNIAYRNNVSTNTVKRIPDSISSKSLGKSHGHLPTCVHFAQHLFFRKHIVYKGVDSSKNTRKNKDHEAI